MPENIPNPTPESTPRRTDLAGNPYFELTPERLDLMREIQHRPAGEKIQEADVELVRGMLVEELEHILTNPNQTAYEDDYEKLEKIRAGEKISGGTTLRDKVARICNDLQVIGPDYDRICEALFSN